MTTPADLIPYLILTATLSASTGWAIGYRTRPFTPPAPGCPCRDTAANNAEFVGRLERLHTDDDTRDSA